MNREYRLNKGPITIKIPEINYKSCRECQYYKTQLVKSGREPEYNHNCEFPNLPNSIIHYLNSWGGNLFSNKTPTWCPYLNNFYKDLNK